MQNLQKNLVTVVVVIILAAGGFLFVQSAQDDKDQSQSTTSEQTASEKTSLTIKDGDKVTEYHVEDAVGKTALEVTESTTTVEKSGEGANAFVTGINGRVADSNKKEFWKLVINGEDAQVGAGSYTVKTKDAISWEIDTFE